MWEPFETHGELRGRIRGVSLPPPARPSQILVWTDAGLFTVWFFRTLSTTKLLTAAETARAFDPATGTLKVQNVTYPVHGAVGPGGELYTTPAATEHPAGDRLEPDPDTDSLLVLDPEGNVRQAIPNYRPAAVPWSVAAFAGDLSVLVVADPHAVRVFKYVPERGAEKPKWAAGGDAAQQRELLRAVLDHPDEDTPRLMYADWLDENRDPARAEFIRLQCRYADRQREHPHPAADADAQRMHTLERQMKARWLAELPAVRGVHWHAFHRGFPTVRVASPTTLVRAAKRVWAAAPVQAAAVTDLTPTGARALASSDCLGRLRHLTLGGYDSRRGGAACVPLLFDNPRAAGLRSLTLTACEITAADARVIARSEHLNALEWLRLSFGAFDAEIARELLASPHLRALKGGPFQAVYGMPDDVRAALRKRFPFA